MTHPVTHADLVRGGRIVNPLANPPGQVEAHVCGPVPRIGWPEIEQKCGG